MLQTRLQAYYKLTVIVVIKIDDKEETNMLKRRENERLKGFGDFLREEEGMGTVEIILIIVVLIGLVIIFKKQLRELVEKVFEKITKDSNTVME